MWVRWGPVGSGGDRLCQTRLIPRSPDGDNNNDNDNCNVGDSLCNKRGPGKPVITNTRSGAIATAHFTSMEIKKCN